MSESSYRLIKSVCLIVIAGASVYAGIQLAEMKVCIWNLVEINANR